jgi:dTDP-4-dehydrorhamnose 3,5-epimerase
MKITTTPIEGLLIITPNVFKDDRGYFFESYSKKKLEEYGLNLDFVQDNQSKSCKGTLRGLHFQAPPYDQGKLVRVITGSVLDIAVDIRPNSPTYGKYHSCLLTEENNAQFWIPSGFAHGFLALEDDTIFSYMCTNYYHKDSEGGLLWNDTDLAINWQLINFEPILSEKDMKLPTFKEFKSPF